MTNRSVVIGGTGTADKQAITSFVLFGGRVDGVGSATSRGYDDMNDMRTRDYMIGDFTGDAERRWASGEIKWYVKTAVMDMTIQNTSELQFALEMDIYEFVCGEMPTAAGPDVESAVHIISRMYIMLAHWELLLLLWSRQIVVQHRLSLEYLCLNSK